ncbi:MAG: DUF433 domain-containing protein [Candidatus Aminicenantes bacterium]|jgi:uncharacterized protein (DUF433 family)
MSLTIENEQVPLKIDSHGVVRVGGTRVTLDTVIAAFKEGATAEEIVCRYPTLHLADVYAVLSYYLRRKQEIEAYLRQREHKAQQVRQQHQNLFELDGIRDRLLARQAKTG